MQKEYLNSDTITFEVGVFFRSLSKFAWKKPVGCSLMYSVLALRNFPPIRKSCIGGVYKSLGMFANRLWWARWINSLIICWCVRLLNISWKPELGHHGADWMLPFLHYLLYCTRTLTWEIRKNSGKPLNNKFIWPGENISEQKNHILKLLMDFVLSTSG